MDNVLCKHIYPTNGPFSCHAVLLSSCPLQKTGRSLISDNTRTQLAPGAPWHETDRRYTDVHAHAFPSVPQEPCSGNCTVPSHSMGAACHPMGILSCNHTSAAAPLTDCIKIIQPTHSLLYWKTRSVGGVGWQVHSNQTRGRNYSPSRKPHSLFLIDGHREHYGHRHNTRSDVNVISQLFAWWRNAVPLKGITWLLECMEPWRWVTWLVRWSLAASFSHDQHTYTQLLMASKGQSEGKSSLRINDVFVHFLRWLG